MVVVIAFVSAVIYGGSDFVGGLASRRITPLLTSFVAFCVAMVFIVIAVLTTGPVWSIDAVVLGAIAGLSAGIGQWAFLAALAIGPMSVISPAVAMIFALVPAIVGIASGERFPPFGYVALVVVVGAAVLLSVPRGPVEQRLSARAVVLGLVAGIGFAGYLIAIDRTPAESGFVPNLMDYVVGITLFATALVIRRVRSGPDELRGLRSGRPVLLAVVSGITLAAANMLLVTALHLGDLALVGVINSLYPLGTVALALIVLRERLSRLQLAGIVLGIAAAAVLAALEGRTPPVGSQAMPLPFSTASGADVRVRFCPSPTGTPHVGMVRTALFNWAYARHTGGTMVFRIEDTDAARDSEESYLQLIDALRWLGLDWDEGVEIGGPHGPYRQSQRGEIYRDVIARLLAAGHLYESFITPEEMEARNRAAGRDPRQGYDNSDRDLTDEERAAHRAEGRQPSLRLRVPDGELSFDDLIRGEITFPAGSFTDFVVVRPNGAPLYTFVNPVDDALMGVNHVFRGEDILSSTPRQIALYLALIDIGVADSIPRFAHMPLVYGEGSKKLSKRDPESNLFHHRDRGFVPEGLLNYLALLGWSIAPDRDVFTQDEFVAAFDIRDVNPNPARFDQKKADAINGDHIRMLAADDFETRIVPYLAGIVENPPTPAQAAILREAAPLVQERVTVLSEVRGMLEFLFTADDAVEFDADALPKNADEARLVLDASIAALEPVNDWGREPIEEALRAALIDGAGLKPRIAFGPLRTALSGRRISPPLFESIEILGKESTLARLERFRTSL